MTPDVSAADERRAYYAGVHAARRRPAGPGGAASPELARLPLEYLMAALKAQLDDTAIVMNEGITNYHLIYNHLGMTRPGSMFTSGAGSLGWSGGARDPGPSSPA